MKTRLISVAVMLPFILFLILGGIPLLVLCFVLSALVLYEFFEGFEKLEIKCSKPLALALLLVLYGSIFGALLIAKNWELTSLLIEAWVFLAVAAPLMLIVFDNSHNILGPTYTLLGMFYIGFSISNLILLDQKSHPMASLPIIIACCADIGGYLGGVYFGKHKLSPVLSPKKTIEGSVGGLILGVLGSLIFALIFCREHLAACLVMGLLGSLIAEIGDLIASAFKRKMGIKDYSNLIPGHGGIFDRLDSICLVIPFVYYFSCIFNVI